MLIDVKPILHTPGGERTFQFELDLSDMEFAGRYPISRPVIVEGVDLRMKSQRGADPAEELKLLLARLGAARK